MNVSWQTVQCSGLYPMIVVSHLRHCHCICAPIFDYTVGGNANLGPFSPWG
ncbi:hypothetical protein ACQ24_gp04 [Propionibacterium phage Pacnes 2012-15]|uniref:Uncharacterized protein n=1 Tax=Propionibacterium phage Pacnes 2012-15 TaxID=1498188 RepID=A0A0A7CHF7_9CAUD|nr:hypothetical protein ACQ24_gp04 [Propionibacterium phage Pacnes 2012-15]AID18002.1 hypothetical protein [Propionibacterium phage Pacnes 2012-15]